MSAHAAVETSFKAKKKGTDIIQREWFSPGGDGDDHGIVFTPKASEDMKDLIFVREGVPGGEQDVNAGLHLREVITHCHSYFLHGLKLKLEL